MAGQTPLRRRLIYIQPSVRRFAPVAGQLPEQARLLAGA
jgi:hypothetical protein